MSVIRTSFGYQLGQLPQFRTRAYNERGPGLYSELNTVGGLIETEPTKMNKPTRNQTLTQSQITIDWTPLIAPQTGNSPITSYNLQWQNQGVWQDLLGVSPESTLTEFTLTSDFQRGQTYAFRVRAANIHGWGEWSDSSLIKAAGIPYKI